MTKTHYLFPLLVLLVWIMLSACGNIAQPQVKQTAISPLPTITQKIVQQIISPIINATSTPIPKKVKPTSKPLPTSSPTLSPTPTLRPSPIPSPTFVPLPPLDETLQTIVFATNNEQGSEIWRVQVDEQGKNTKPAELLKHISSPGYAAVYIYGLYPSPTGQWVAIDWAFGSTTHVDILDVATGQITPLFGETNIDQRVTFLDWSPDGQNILVMGGTSNPDLGNSAWLVDVNTHLYHDIGIKQKNEIPHIYGASFSPDGKMIVYTHSYINGEIWRLDLESSKQNLLYRTESIITHVSWSPNGSYIAFTQLHKDENFAHDKFITGDLHIMGVDGSEEQILSSLMINYKKHRFHPVWSPNNQQIVFVKNESQKPQQKLEYFIGNIYMIDLKNNQIEQLTNYQNAKTINPIWKADGSEIAFLVNEQESDVSFYLKKITINEDKSHSLNVDTIISNMPDNPSYFDTQSNIVWFP